MTFPLMTLVHQDNVLIDQHGNARLADFGLLSILPDSITSSSSGGAGAYQWMSPELFDPNRFGLKNTRRTKSSDCYALGMTTYEVLSGHFPFPSFAGLRVVAEVLNDVRPRRPQGAGGGWFTDDVWEILEHCWNPEPGDRPSVDCVLQCLEKASKMWTLSPLIVEGPQVADLSAITLSELTIRGPSAETTT